MGNLVAADKIIFRFSRWGGSPVATSSCLQRKHVKRIL